MGILTPAVAIAVALIVTAVAVDPARRLAKKCGFIAEPRPDRFHLVATPLFGGPACLLGAGVAAWIVGSILFPTSESDPTEPLLGLSTWIGAGGFLLLGLLDDRRSFSPFWKATAQGVILGAVLLIWGPEGRLDSPMALGLSWVIGILLLNAWNYLDHADGVFPTVMALAAAALALVWGETGMGGGMAVGLLWGLAGAMIGFLVWNLPPARVFLGDAGSLPLAFVLLHLSMAVVDRGPLEAVPTAVSVHSVAFLDLLLVTTARLRSRRHPFQGGRDHSGHRLANRIGPTRALLVYLLGMVGFIGLALTLGSRYPETMPLALAALYFVGLSFLLRLPTPKTKSESSRKVPDRRTRRRHRSI